MSPPVKWIVIRQGCFIITNKKTKSPPSGTLVYRSKFALPFLISVWFEDSSLFFSSFFSSPRVHPDALCLQPGLVDAVGGADQQGVQRRRGSRPPGPRGGHVPGQQRQQHQQPLHGRLRRAPVAGRAVPEGPVGLKGRRELETESRTCSCTAEYPKTPTVTCHFTEWRKHSRWLSVQSLWIVCGSFAIFIPTILISRCLQFFFIFIWVFFYGLIVWAVLSLWILWFCVFESPSCLFLPREANQESTCANVTELETRHWHFITTHKVACHIFYTKLCVIGEAPFKCNSSTGESCVLLPVVLHFSSPFFFFVK